MNDPNKLPETEDGQNALPAAQNPTEGTVAHDSATQDVGSSPPPAQIGRYRIDKVLGEGGFGRVYLGFDEELKRQVALKVPRPERVSRPSDVEAYLIEARTLASLDHPGIVPVYDVGHTDDGLCYVVSKFIEGTDLHGKLEQHRLPHHESADLVATVCEALHYAHSKGLVHRDIKPANILIDSDGEPYVADFGLALKEEDIGSGSGWAGTPNYMSPEQARGEGHLVDGRSDIFSTGVMFYEMLAGKRPFRGDTSQKLLEQISSVEARPLRQRDASIPKELERICLKALSKKASDRYTTAKDMADDLRHFLSESPETVSAASVTPADSQVTSGVDTRIASGSSTAASASDSQAIKVVPKGLRSFDAKDSDFFLELLPGPRDRDGLPDGIRFWKDHIEETDADETFRVGLIYGPSGCGKSSLVKAGLLPRLSDNVIAIYVEATPDETESRLLHGLRKHCSGLPGGLSLKDTLTALRRGQGLPNGKKVMIVLDQFEQWLHAHREAVDTELVAALRQCDGSRVQVVVMVRDDFWLAVSRFMKDLEVKLLEGQNSALVDLFDMDHARKVLTAFGRAFGRLPESSAKLTSDQSEFLKSSVTGLAEEGKVICVRLALFAEMMKGKPWTPATLKAVGGTTGVGVTFLEETFSASTAPPEHRYHQKAARNVLRALLPESGTDIKGHMRSSDKLLEASGYARRPSDFRDLISILDSEIRLVTPTDPEGDQSGDNHETPDVDPDKKYYQLTHDYLVPSLREWLTRKQRETRKGRAELRLVERSALWKAKPENRHLPSWWEYLSVVGLTAPKERTEQQRKMMRAAGRFHGARATAILLLLAVGTAAGLTVRRKILAERAAGYVSAALSAHPNALSWATKDVLKLPDDSLESLRKHLGDGHSEPPNGDLTPMQQLHGLCALAALEEVRVAELVGHVTYEPFWPRAECENIVAALAVLPEAALQEIGQAADGQPKAILKARLALVALALGDAELASEMCQLGPNPTERSAFVAAFPAWHGSLIKLADDPDRPELANDPALVSALCLGVGSVASTTGQSDDIAVWQPLLEKWFQQHPNSAVHSAAGWALREWQIPKLKLPSRDRPHDGSDWFVTKTPLTWIRIPAGEFVRQDDDDETAKPQTAGLTRDLWLSDREVTVQLFREFVEDDHDERWDQFGAPGPQFEYPVQQVSWEDAVKFCNWLSRREKRTVCYRKKNSVLDFVPGVNSVWNLVPGATGYRLPTEAEWEYACRAGTAMEYQFGFGNDDELLEDYGWFENNASKRTQPVGRKMPNNWGLFDMHGNVWEWCHDWLGPFGDAEPSMDAIGPAAGSDKVYRGGGWRSSARACRSARRSDHSPSFKSNYIGFRLAVGAINSAEP